MTLDIFKDYKPVIEELETALADLDIPDSDAVYFQSKIKSLGKDIEDAHLELRRLYRYLDLGVQDIINDINQISDLQSALEAYFHYNLKWFANSYYSPIAMTAIAEALIAKISPFIPVNSFWYEVSKGDFKSFSIDLDDEETSSESLINTRLGDKPMDEEEEEPAEPVAPTETSQPTEPGTLSGT